jgi:hypothetical protein
VRQGPNRNPEPLPKTLPGVVCAQRVRCGKPGRSLADLGAAIEAAHREVGHLVTATLEKARHAGELLAEAKRQVPHGGWLPWIEANCKIPARTAQLYVQIAANWVAVLAHPGYPELTLQEASRAGREPQPNTQPVAYFGPADEVCDQLEVAARAMREVSDSLRDDAASDTWTIDGLAEASRLAEECGRLAHAVMIDAMSDLGEVLKQLPPEARPSGKK